MGAQPQTLKRRFYERPAVLVAESLIGKVFSYGALSGRIVEVEAYDESEQVVASQEFERATRRCSVHLDALRYTFRTGSTT